MSLAHRFSHIANLIGHPSRALMLDALLGADHARTVGPALHLPPHDGLGLAAGAMLFVVSHEVIPETHRNGHQTHATLGLMAGFALMMTLDTALG